MGILGALLAAAACVSAAHAGEIRARIELHPSLLDSHVGLIGPGGRYPDAESAKDGLAALLERAVEKLESEPTLFSGTLRRNLEATLFEPKRTLLFRLAPAGPSYGNGFLPRDPKKPAVISITETAWRRFLEWVVVHEFLHLSGEGHDLAADPADVYAHSTWGLEIVTPCADYAVERHEPYSRALCMASLLTRTPQERALLRVGYLASRAMEEPEKVPFERLAAGVDSEADAGGGAIKPFVAYALRYEAGQGESYSEAQTRAFAKFILESQALNAAKR